MRVASDSQGRIYVAGKTTVLNGRSAVSQWLVRRSSQGGANGTWEPVDTVANGYACGVGRDAAGNIVVVGKATDSSGTHWLVRRPDTQGVFAPVDDDYQLATGKSAQATGVTADAAGNLLVTGSAQDASGIDHWIVRKY